jgi:hypothetical protein
MSWYDHARSRARTWIVTAATLAPALLLPAVAAHAAQSAARKDPAVVPYVVSLGDSYISGEAGRWAGNTSSVWNWHMIDALGPTAYFDNANHTAELIPGCHRSRSAEIGIGGPVGTMNLACSGARTSTFFDDGFFKPGLDFYNANGHQGQALMLEEFAKTHHVTMVAVSIGGNDFGFGDIVASCFKDFYIYSSPFKNYYCKDDSSVTDHISPQNIAAVTGRIVAALRNVNAAMAMAGYNQSSYKILLQNYPAPLPYGSAIRYPETRDRQDTGGCGLWNTDIDWALNNALPKISAAVFAAANQSGLGNIVKMDISSSFDNRRLCQNTVGTMEEKGLTSWEDPRAVNETEWINQIHILTPSFFPFYQQESLHPNYWAQLALRNCVRQAYNNGAVRGGSCTMSGTGTNPAGEPNMRLVDTSVLAGVDPGGRLNVFADGRASVTDGVRQVAVASDPVHGPLIAELDTSGVVWAKQGNLNGVWVRQYTGATQVAVASDAVHGPLIAVVAQNGSAYAKQSIADLRWTHLIDGAARLSVASDAVHGPLIAVLQSSGSVLAKEGSLSADWVRQADAVHQVAVAADPVGGPLIAVLTTQGSVWAKQGSLNANWVRQYDRAAQVAVGSDQVNGPLISVLDTGGTLWAKQGSLNASWVRQFDSVDQAAVATDPVHGPLISTVYGTRRWQVKQGSLTAPWFPLLPNIVQISVASA